MAILWWIIVGLVAGWGTGKSRGGAGFGFIMDIVVGIIGALIGGFIVSRLGLAASGGMIYTIIVAIFGAIILTLIVRLITGKNLPSPRIEVDVKLFRKTTRAPNPVA